MQQIYEQFEPHRRYYIEFARKSTSKSNQTILTIFIHINYIDYILTNHRWKG